MRKARAYGKKTMAENIPDTNVGNIKYIRKQDAVHTIMGQPPDAHYPSWYGAQIEAIPAADVVSVEILIAEIYKLKCQQDSKNQDYYTGYMSALSTVEGILAEMGEED